VNLRGRGGKGSSSIRRGQKVRGERTRKEKGKSPSGTTRRCAKETREKICAQGIRPISKKSYGAPWGRTLQRGGKNIYSLAAFDEERKDLKGPFAWGGEEGEDVSTLSS